MPERPFLPAVDPRSVFVLEGRLMHLPYVYKRLHKYHHYYKSPEPFDDLVSASRGSCDRAWELMWLVGCVIPREKYPHEEELPCGMIGSRIDASSIHRTRGLSYPWKDDHAGEGCRVLWVMTSL